MTVTGIPAGSGYRGSSCNHALLGWHRFAYPPLHIIIIIIIIGGLGVAVVHRP